MSHRKYTRREVLKAGVAAIALHSIVPRHVLGLEGESGANEQVKVAIIGLGGRAGGVVADVRGLKGMKIGAVSDCFAPRIGDFIKKHGTDQGWKGYEDFRKMIETEKPDGVMVETTTHARAWITIQAMQMGCDAYIEKPMSLTIAEGRHMVGAARKYRRVTQVGTLPIIGNATSAITGIRASGIQSVFTGANPATGRGASSAARRRRRARPCARCARCGRRPSLPPRRPATWRS